MSDEIEWPREIWLAELDQHHNGTGMVVLSEFATVSRWEGDDERDCDFQRYVDADIHESAEKYHKAKVDELRATAAAQVAAAYERGAELFDEKHHVFMVAKGRNPSDYMSEFSNAADKLRALATDTQTDALEQVRREAERAGYERMRAKAEKLVQYLDRIDSASNHYAMTPTYSEGTLSYAHQSTSNLAREALKEWYEGDPDEQTEAAQRCAECDCENGGEDCNWIKKGTNEQTEAAQELAFRKAVSS